MGPSKDLLEIKKAGIVALLQRGKVSQRSIARIESVSTGAVAAIAARIWAGETPTTSRRKNCRRPRKTRARVAVF